MYMYKINARQTSLLDILIVLTLVTDKLHQFKHQLESGS